MKSTAALQVGQVKHMPDVICDMVCVCVCVDAEFTVETSHFNVIIRVTEPSIQTFVYNFQ